MSGLRKLLSTLLFLAALAVVVIVGASFAWLNPDKVQLNLAFAEMEVLKSQAFAVTLALGWLLGVLSSLGVILKIQGEKRRLRREARQAETEVDKLRRLPIHDGG